MVRGTERSCVAANAELCGPLFSITTEVRDELHIREAKVSSTQAGLTQKNFILCKCVYLCELAQDFSQQCASAC